jgi:hypothetical protein
MKIADIVYSYKTENMRTAVTATSSVRQNPECFQENLKQSLFLNMKHRDVNILNEMKNFKKSF